MKKTIINILWFLFGVIIVAFVTALLFVGPLVYKLATICDRNPAILRDCNK